MNTVSDYKLVENLHRLVGEIEEGAIVSKTFLRAGGLKAIAFGFATGQELSEHTASVPAILQIVEGEATVTLGEDHFELGAGAWAYMPARLPHGIWAKTPVKMLLLMLEREA